MNTIVVKDMDVTIQLGVITNVIGPSNSGKTTLLKKLINMIDNSDVFIDDVSIKEYDITFLKNNLVVVLDDNDFNCEYVAEELFFYLDKLGYRIDEITKKIDVIAKYFKITDILDQRIDLIPLEKRILVKILSFLIIDPKIIGIDNLLLYLNKTYINLIIKYVKEKNISLINVTSDSELLLLSDDVVVMNNFKAIICGNVNSVLEGNSILPYIGIKLPFAVDLSHNLILYGVIDKVMNDSRKMVDKIWK